MAQYVLYCTTTDGEWIFLALKEHISGSTEQKTLDSLTGLAQLHFLPS